MKSYKYLPYILFPLFLFLLLMPLLTGRCYPQFDAREMGYPAFTYLADSVREGRFPLWDPYTNCGYPYHADAGGMTLNIPAILLGLAVSNSIHGFILLWVIYWCWAGLGMIWLAKNFGASPLGAFLAGIAYSLSGFFVAHSEHNGFILTAAWFPWIFGLADKAVGEASLGYALLTGAAAGFCTLGGYPGLWGFLGIALLLWLVLRHRRAVWILITLCVIGTVMLAAWSPMLKAFFTEGSGYTDRITQLDPHLANFGFPFPLSALVSLFFPYATLILHPLLNADRSMTDAYVGLLTIPLAAVWLIKGGAESKKDGGSGFRRTWWLLAFALFMFIVSLGGQAGLRTLLYYIYPPMRFMRFSAPFRVFWIFALSLGAGLGFSHLERHPDHRAFLLRLSAAWAIIGLITGIALAIACGSDGISVREVFLNLYLPAIIAAALAVPLLLYWSKNRQGTLYRLAPIFLAVIAMTDMSMHLYDNSFMVYSSDFVPLINSVESMRVRSTHVDGGPAPRIAERVFGPMNAQQVLKVPLVSGYMTMKSKGFDETLLNSRFVEVLSAPYRFWVSPGVTHAVSRESALDVLAGTGAGEPVPVFVEDTDINLPDAKATPGSFGAARITSYDPEKIEMDVDVPPGPGGFLASTERYAAGWKAFVDGKEQRVYKTNLYFRGIFLSPGNHSVIWKYEPRLWNQLVPFSFASLLATALAAIYLLKREKGRTKPSHRPVD